MRPRIRVGPMMSLDMVTPIEVVGKPSLLMMGDESEFRKNILRMRKGERSRSNMRHDSKRGKVRGR